MLMLGVSADGLVFMQYLSLLLMLISLGAYALRLNE